LFQLLLADYFNEASLPAVKRCPSQPMWRMRNILSKVAYCVALVACYLRITWCVNSWSELNIPASRKEKQILLIKFQKRDFLNLKSQKSQLKGYGYYKNLKIER